MARWRLSAPHYLRTEGVKWEYSEVDRKTGRPRKVTFDVPLYLNPYDPNDWTETWGNRDNADGQIIVCQGESNGTDIVFYGDPTPDMVPLDPEALAISSNFTERWRYKPDEGLPGTYSQSLIDQFQSKMNDVQAAPSGVAGLSELVEQMAASAARQDKFLELLVAQQAAPTEAPRRI